MMAASGDHDQADVSPEGPHAGTNTPLLLEHLGPDILIMVFEQVYSISPDLLPSLRLLSRRIDQIVARLSYHRILLSVKKLNAVSGPAKREDIIRNIHAHTRHVEVQRLLDWDAVVELLSDCVQLDALTWACGQELFQCYFPEAMRRLVHDEWPNIHIINTFLDYPGKGGGNSFLKTFPASNIRSLHFHNRGGQRFSSSLQEFLVACKTLERLRLDDFPGTLEPSKGRLPPVRKLSLDYLDSPYTRSEVPLIWDFSRLEDLRTHWHNLGLISAALQHSSLCRLYRLNIYYTWGSEKPPSCTTDDDYHEIRTAFLNSLLQEALENQFEALETVCHLPSFSIPALARHGYSLRRLSLLDISGFEVDGRLTPTTTVSDLEILQSSCPHITALTLGVNFDMPKRKRPAFLDLLGSFRNVTILSLYMQKTPKKSELLSIDHVYKFALSVATYLRSHKHGLSLSTLSINVGEWAPRNRPHRIVKSWDVAYDRSEAYQPRRLLEFFWDTQGAMSVKEPGRLWDD